MYTIEEINKFLFLYSDEGLSTNLALLDTTVLNMIDIKVKNGVRFKQSFDNAVSTNFFSNNNC